MGSFAHLHCAPPRRALSGTPRRPGSRCPRFLAGSPALRHNPRPRQAPRLMPQIAIRQIGVIRGHLGHPPTFTPIANEPPLSADHHPAHPWIGGEGTPLKSVLNLFALRIKHCPSSHLTAIKRP